MVDLENPDQIVLRAAVGWLELELPQDALRELDHLSAPAQGHPDVLEVRWMILAHLQNWNEALPISARLAASAPDRASSWLHHAYTTRRADGGGLLEAYKILAPAAEKFTDEPILFYNLACYSCQLGRGDEETMQWFDRALRVGDRKRLVEMALNDSDLAPLRDRIKALGRA